MGIFGFLADIVGLNFRKNRERKNLKILVNSINEFCNEKYDSKKQLDYLSKYDNLMTKLTLEINNLVDSRTEKSSKIYKGLLNALEKVKNKRPSGPIKDMIQDINKIFNYKGYVNKCDIFVGHLAEVQGGRLSVWNKECKNALYKFLDLKISENILNIINSLGDEEKELKQQNDNIKLEISNYWNEIIDLKTKFFKTNKTDKKLEIIQNMIKNVFLILDKGEKNNDKYIPYLRESLKEFQRSKLTENAFAEAPIDTASLQAGFLSEVEKWMNQSDLISKDTDTAWGRHLGKLGRRKEYRANCYGLSDSLFETMFKLAELMNLGSLIKLTKNTGSIETKEAERLVYCAVKVPVSRGTLNDSDVEIKGENVIIADAGALNAYDNKDKEMLKGMKIKYELKDGILIITLNKGKNIVVGTIKIPKH